MYLKMKIPQVYLQDSISAYHTLKLKCPNLDIALWEYVDK